jgi:hypothetical protein
MNKEEQCNNGLYGHIGTAFPFATLARLLKCIVGFTRTSIQSTSIDIDPVGFAQG